MQLAIGGDRLVGTAGGDYTILDVRNTGGRCLMTGYPTVQIFDGTGALISAPAQHRPGPTPLPVLALATGARAEFELYDFTHTATSTSAPITSCDPDYGHGRTLKMTLPGQTVPVVIDYGYSACRLSVTELHDPMPHPVGG